MNVMAQSSNQCETELLRDNDSKHSLCVETQSALLR